MTDRLNPLPDEPTASVEKGTLYAIVDCAHFDHKFYRKIRRLNVTTKSLFAGTKDESSALAGPVLLQIDPNDDLYAIDEL